MQAPLSDRIRRILSDPKLAKKLMQAIQSERRNPEDIEGKTIEFDGKKLVLTRATALVPKKS
jgi:hypothetical protein